jgi:alpha-tubulin suppressor-like RCC1 family protein
MRSRAALTLRLLTVSTLAVVLAAAAGSGRAGTSLVPLITTGSGATTVPATAIAAGLGHSCALNRAGGVKCWGDNGHDQLGDQTTGNRVTPVDVSGLSVGVTAIAAGVRHTCALTRAGSVKCWGANISGALGDGTTNRRPRRVVDVFGLSGGVTAIAAGFDHSCALTSAGRVKCWGSNRFGQLGDDTTNDRWSPVEVVGLSGVRAIAAGGFQSCALTTDRGVKCWGGSTGRTPTPVDVSGLAGAATAITVNCALVGTGGLKCWGSDRKAVDVPGLSSGVAAIATGFHGCALMTTRGVKCWGLNDHGQLGDGTTVDRSTPVEVSGLIGDVTAIVVGSFHSCALVSTGGVKCWGQNGSGQLGDRTTRDRRTPVGVIGFGATEATLAIVSRSVRVTRAGVAAIKLRCGAQARCRGTLTLTASVDGELVGSLARRVQVTLGSRTFSIAASDDCPLCGGAKPQTVKAKLTPQSFKLLTRVKRLSAHVRASYKQPAGGTTRVTRTIRLTAPKR